MSLKSKAGPCCSTWKTFQKTRNVPLNCIQFYSCQRSCQKICRKKEILKIHTFPSRMTEFSVRTQSSEKSEQSTFIKAFCVLYIVTVSICRFTSSRTISYTIFCRICFLLPSRSGLFNVSSFYCCFFFCSLCFVVVDAVIAAAAAA